MMPPGGTEYCFSLQYAGVYLKLQYMLIEFENRDYSSDSLLDLRELPA